MLAAMDKNVYKTVFKKWRAGLERECWQQQNLFQPVFMKESARSNERNLISVCFHKMESGVGEEVLAATKLISTCFHEGEC